MTTRRSPVWRIAAVVGPPLLLVLAVTAMDMGSTPTRASFILSGHFLLNAGPAMLILAVAIALSRNAAFSAILAGVICSVFYVSNTLKRIFWNAYLTPDDLHLLFAPADVLGVIADHLNTALVMALAGMLLGLLGALFLAWRDGPKINLSAARSVLLLFFAGAIAVTLYAVRRDAEPTLARLGMTQSIWRLDDQLTYGLFNHLYLTSALNGLNREMFEGDPSRIVEYASEKPPRLSARPRKPPDIVVLLAESFFDPATLQTTLLADPIGPLRAGGANNRAFGLTRVYTSGGGTWISEHQFVTGIPGPTYGPTGRWPFALADENTWSIAKAVRRSGYKTIVVYGARDDFIFDSRNIYRGLGFDRYYDIDDVEERFGPADGTADGRVLHAVSRILEEESGPVFVFAVSVDLHTPYIPTPGHGRFLGAGMEAPTLEAYLRDQAMFTSKVANFLDKQDREKGRLLFALFGDHIPPLGRQMSQIGFREGIKEPLYRTPYLLHSTYGSLNADIPYLDLTYLAGLILDQAELNSNEYFRINSMMRDLCDGHLRDCDVDRGLIDSYYAYLAQNIAIEP